MSNTNYTQNLLQAMTIVADKAIKNAGYDKTIKATVIECKDATIGQYKVRYQDGCWLAYTNDINTSYPKGSTVYILVPKGDMNQHKTILGIVKKLGINYINTIEEKNRYAEVGSNTLTGNMEYGLCSYQSYSELLYDVNNASLNKIKIDTAATAQYIKKSTHFMCSMDVRTSLPLGQRSKGSYGIKFELLFADNITGQNVTRNYYFTIDQMQGNPYYFVSKVNQSFAFEIDSDNFKRISKIQIFVKDFPVQNKNIKIKDIFISNISFKGVVQLSQEEMNNVSLSFVAKNGYIFNSNSNNNEERSIQAQVRVQGKAINNDSQKLTFYWFVQNISVTTGNPYYNQYGGIGWKCLNPQQTINSSIVFKPLSYLFTITKDEIKVREQKYKCVVIYENNTFSKEFTIYNYDASYIIKVTSNKGTEFEYDSGYPTLTCSVTKTNGEDNTSNFNYSWGMIDNNGNSFDLSFDKDKYNKYISYKEQYNKLKKGFEEKSIFKNGKTETGSQTNINRYNTLASELNNLNKTQIVYNNQIINLNIKQITNFSTFICSVFDKNNNLIGSDSITIVNKLNSNGGYSLVINNGTQVFNYNEDGVSPCKIKEGQFIYTIPELSFTLYDANGSEIDKNEIKNTDIKWKIPLKNTLLKCDYVDGTPNAQGTYITYTEKRTFIYTILDKYYSNKTQNDIQLQIKYHGYTLFAKTNLTFTKQGFLGTNGTGLVAKINPIFKSNKSSIPTMEVDGTNVSFNFSKLQAQLWKDGQKIKEEDINCTWSILKNTGEANNTILKISNLEKSSITLSKNDKNINEQNLINIIKLAIIYNDITYYTTLPIVTCKKINNNYDVSLKPNTGFRYVTYSEDGRYPQYDNHQPFIFEIKTKINGIEEDVTNTSVKGYQQKYSFSKKGNFTIKKFSKNTCEAVPDSTYDGSDINNYLICNVYVDSKLVSTIYVPIHFMLNRYGHAALNDWDGNSISIGGETKETILAPQVGAGSKDKKTGTFTGVLMGKIKNENKEQSGLFGYVNGARSIFLDATTGKAEFGKMGKGQIKIDPSTNEAIITSGNYNEKDKTGTGLKINLSEPTITYGSKNFFVTKKGYLNAKGGGEIAGWIIGEDQLSKGMVGLSSNNTKITKTKQEIDNTKIAFWAGHKEKDKAPFKVNFKGDLQASSGVVGGWMLSDHSIAKGINLKKEANDFGPKKKDKKTGEYTYTGVYTIGMYFGEGGLRMGSNFSVDSNGNMKLTSLNFNNSNLHIIGNKIYSKQHDSFQSDKKGFYLGPVGLSIGDTFKVNESGEITAKKGVLANWVIEKDALRTTNAYNGYYETGTSKVKAEKNQFYLGRAGLRIGENFHIDRNGNLWANSGDFTGKITSSEGEIAGWKISASSLTGGDMIINSNGSISGGSEKKGHAKWSINENGIATFSKINITGGEISGGTISGGTRTGGKISGGTIGGSAKMNGGSFSPSKVNNADGKGTILDWADEIVTGKITADYIYGKIGTLAALKVAAIDCGGTKFRACTMKIQGNGYNYSLKFMGKEDFTLNLPDIPKLVTKNINGVSVYGP